jgi:hypothetical protein
MPYLSLSYWIYALLLACLAVCWASILVDAGMLLAPAQRALRHIYRANTGNEIDTRWWWAPIWGCYKCVAGQWAFWGYLLLFPLSAYSLLAHLGFTAITIILSIILQKWTAQ